MRLDTAEGGTGSRPTALPSETAAGQGRPERRGTRALVERAGLSPV